MQMKWPTICNPVPIFSHDVMRACVCEHTCVWVHMHVPVCCHVCRGLELTSYLFLNHCSPQDFFFSAGSLAERRACQFQLSSQLSYSGGSSTFGGILGGYCAYLVSLWLLGTCTLVLTLTQQVPLSHLPGPVVIFFIDNMEFHLLAESVQQEQKLSQLEELNIFYVLFICV